MTWREARQRSGLSQEDAAEAVGIDANSISRYERGERQPSLIIACRLCRVYGCSLKDIIGGVNNEL